MAVLPNKFSIPLTEAVPAESLKTPDPEVRHFSINIKDVEYSTFHAM